MQRNELGRFLDDCLKTAQFRDYCPNGLQVEGREKIQRLVCGVTASLALIEAAIAARADAVLVHHGLFWRGDDARVTGFRKQRLSRLLAENINLYAYHLPLDAHPELGNNAQLAQRMGWQIERQCGEQNLVFMGNCPPQEASSLAAALSRQLGRKAQLLGDGRRQIKQLAWCSGGAQGYFEEAVLAGADCYVSGEVSEQNYHLALETGVPYIAVGHHASERYGVQALADLLSRQHGLECHYVELDNPI